MLKNECRIISCEIVSRLEGNVVKNEGTDNTVHSANTQLMEVLSTKPLGDSQ